MAHKRYKVKYICKKETERLRRIGALEENEFQVRETQAKTDTSAPNRCSKCGSSKTEYLNHRDVL